VSEPVRITVHLAAVHVNGRPVGPHAMRLLRAIWTADMHTPGFPYRHLNAYRRRMSAMHTAYRTKTKGR